MHIFKVFNKISLRKKLSPVLYRNLEAQILTNRMLQPNFELLRGTKRGAPFLFLFFRLAFKTLAHSVHTGTSIYRTDTIDIVYKNKKITLYADDILLLITQLTPP